MEEKVICPRVAYNNMEMEEKAIAALDGVKLCFETKENIVDVAKKIMALMNEMELEQFAQQGVIDLVQILVSHQMNYNFDNIFNVEKNDGKKRFTLRMDSDLFEKINALAKINKRSAGKEIECAIAAWVRKALTRTAEK